MAAYSKRPADLQDTRDLSTQNDQERFISLGAYRVVCLLIPVLELKSFVRRKRGSDLVLDRKSSHAFRSCN